jgi:hypothetical protein
MPPFRILIELYFDLAVKLKAEPNGVLLLPGVFSDK